MKEKQIVTIPFVAHEADMNRMERTQQKQMLNETIQRSMR